MDPTISREHSDVCQAIKTALITQGACIPEYGRIVIFKKGTHRGSLVTGNRSD